MAMLARKEPDWNAANSLLPKIKKNLEAGSRDGFNAVQRWADAGELFEQAKEILGHGKFMGWVEANFDISHEQANKCMKLHRARSDKLLPDDQIRQLTIRGALGSLAEAQKTQAVVSQGKAKSNSERVTNLKVLSTPPQNGKSHSQEKPEKVAEIDESRPHPKILKDKKGVAIPENIRSGWLQAGILDDWQKAVADVQDQVEAWATQNEPALSFLPIRGLLSQLKDVAATLAGAKPFAVCPACQAHHRAMPRCTACRANEVQCGSVGWVNKTTYEGLSHLT